MTHVHTVSITVKDINEKKIALIKMGVSWFVSNSSYYIKLDVMDET